MAEGFSRRSFIKLAATAGAAAAIPGCQPAARKLIPYVVPDENNIPGVPSFYATTCNECSAGCGIIGKVREGRVIKLEGNPGDPISRGAICARGQAGLQGLYNPDRLSAPMMRQPDGKLKKISWDDAIKEFATHLKDAASKGNDRIAVIASPPGPTLQKITTAFLGAYKSKGATYYEPLDDGAARGASQIVFGRRDLPSYRIDQAEVLISFGADFLETWRSPIELARQYAEFRAPKKRNGALTIGRAIYVGPRFNMTAAKCDEWLASPAGAEATIALSILHVILAQGWVPPNSGLDVAALKNFVVDYDPNSTSQRTGISADRISKIAERFGKAAGALALAGGDDPTTHAAAYILNAATGNLGRTMQFNDDEPPESVAKNDEVAAAIEKIRIGIVGTSSGVHNGVAGLDFASSQVDVLVIAGSNPLYSMPHAWRTDEAFRKAPFVVWMGSVPDETAEVAHLLLPIHHPLESWRDTFPRAGVHGLGQPVMQPVFDSRPLGDILIALAHQSGGAQLPWKDTADAVKTEWVKLNQGTTGAAADQFWVKSLTEGGVFSAPKPAKVALNLEALKSGPTAREVQKLALHTYPHPFLYDGRGADKPWLQEIPEPVTQIVWDSWAEIHPDTAKEIGVASNEIVEVTSSEGSLKAPVLISARVAKGVIAVPLGQGHTSMGRYARNRGANAFALLRPRHLQIEVTARATGESQNNVSPAGNDFMLQRTFAEAVSIEQLANNVKPKYIEEELPDVPYEMYKSYVPNRKHMWGMTIDLNACTGCSACVAACYAENNVPVVGKDQVEKGRHMAWIRMDRYFPEPNRPEPQPQLYLMPMLCQQCDHAPCEPVCPVFAAVHTEEGLNGQIYNRCVGTRYCENNCPYKVRRFNYFEPEWPEPMHLQLNPDVTARSMGVMEKCTFCIQRITDTEINAKIEKRAVRDGEIVTACAQACPVKAISFGDMKDPNSEMMRRREANKDRGYRSLEDLNTQPAIMYLRNVYHEREKA
ncbi:MAG TPA: molybdopterin-dependent oxidoreductase [Candidatus Binataceae bacterium]|nr:molybdopterin-dependent oxidoreductase [Candidatus Binataceae bacterium]